MIVYIDDILLMAATVAKAKSHLEALTSLLTGLGFINNVQESITSSTQQIDFLGLKVDSVSLHPSLPGETLHHIRMEVRQHLQRPQVTARMLAQLIGKTVCSFAGSSPATSFLPVITRRSSQSSEPYQPELGCTGVFVSSSPRRAYLVAGKACSMEWQGSVVQATDDYHHIRCISPGLGSSHQ